MKSKAAIDNRANQLNPNNSAYWSSRGMLPRTGWASCGVAVTGTNELPMYAPAGTCVDGLCISSEAVALALEARKKALREMDHRAVQVAKRLREQTPSSGLTVDHISALRQKAWDEMILRKDQRIEEVQSGLR